MGDDGRHKLKLHLRRSCFTDIPPMEANSAHSMQSNVYAARQFFKPFVSIPLLK
jgi:hypothetical protein